MKYWLKGTSAVVFILLLIATSPVLGESLPESLRFNTAIVHDGYVDDVTKLFSIEIGSPVQSNRDIIYMPSKAYADIVSVARQNQVEVTSDAARQRTMGFMVTEIGQGRLAAAYGVSDRGVASIMKLIEGTLLTDNLEVPEWIERIYSHAAQVSAQ